MAKIIALESCKTTIGSITYIYSRADKKIYFKRLSEKDRDDLLNIFFEDIIVVDANNMKNENDLIAFIQGKSPLPV